MQELWMFNCMPIYPVCEGQILAVFDSGMEEDSIKEAMMHFAEEAGMDCETKADLIYIGEININGLQSKEWHDFDNGILTLQNGNY